jgi:hypothetical protein
VPSKLLSPIFYQILPRLHHIRGKLLRIPLLLPDPRKQKRDFFFQLQKRDPAKEQIQDPTDRGELEQHTAGFVEGVRAAGDHVEAPAECGFADYVHCL